MTPTTGIARKFFEACETGKGWEGCKAYCQPDATFSAQAEPLVGVKNLQQYTDWMKGLLTFVPDGAMSWSLSEPTRSGRVSAPTASTPVLITGRVARAHQRARV
jgi:hypothetical protein